MPGELWNEPVYQLCGRFREGGQSQKRAFRSHAERVRETLIDQKYRQRKKNE